MSSTESVDPNIYLDGNDKVERFALTTPDSDTGDDEAATGLTGLTVHYSLTRGGAAVHASLTKSLTEYSGTLGTYHATMDGADITTRLANKGGTRIFAVLADSAGHVKGSFDRYVKDNR
jgi:hypothetical protein